MPSCDFVIVIYSPSETSPEPKVAKLQVSTPGCNFIISCFFLDLLQSQKLQSYKVTKLQLTTPDCNFIILCFWPIWSGDVYSSTSERKTNVATLINMISKTTSRLSHGGSFSMGASKCPVALTAAMTT